MWIFAATWADAEDGGYQVLFDNMYGYHAQQ
jgi:hypothetical protein